jgi:hypothetical protein
MRSRENVLFRSNDCPAFLIMSPNAAIGVSGLSLGVAITVHLIVDCFLDLPIPPLHPVVPHFTPTSSQGGLALLPDVKIFRKAPMDKPHTPWILWI